MKRLRMSLPGVALSVFVILVLTPYAGAIKPSKEKKSRLPSDSDLSKAASRRRASAIETTLKEFRQRRNLTETESSGNDPDLPRLPVSIDKSEYLRARQKQLSLLRGVEPGSPFDITARQRAITFMTQQETAALSVAAKAAGGLRPEAYPNWLPIGPTPIPNGQTEITQVAVSGRVTCIAVHPTNPNIAYVGTADGGVYRTTNGGTSWTPLMDTAQTLAIGAVTIDPVNPTKLFVGTGEGNLSLDSFFGVGLYRIDNADTSPVINGPFETRVAGTGTGSSNGHAFIGTAITKIVVDPANDNRIFVGNTLGSGGLSGDSIPGGNTNPPAAFIGLYFSDTALGSAPTFSRVNTFFFNGLQGVPDVVFEPGSSNNLLIAVEDFGGSGDTGVYRTTDATSASIVIPSGTPTFTRTYTPAGATTPVVNIKLAINKVGAVVTVVGTTEENPGGGFTGKVLKSIDGGATFPTELTAARGFCHPQCWYDMAPAIDPSNANNIFLGGSFNGTPNPNHILLRSLDGGTSFSPVENTLHADNHAVTFAPSNPDIVYTGNDGGVWKSINARTPTAGSVAWTSLNTIELSATQFQGLAVHRTDANFTIGGTQDNGTNRRNGAGSWSRVDFGDGGFAAIDQNATDTTTVTMYHTYFNASGSLLGYARVLTSACAVDGQWSFKGIYTGPVDPTVHCDGTTDTFNGIGITNAVNFYAPLVLGPNAADSAGTNTVYYGSDRLYRSANRGDSVTVVSQAPILAGIPISAIAISPQDDNYRFVGLNNGALLFTTTGSSTLTSLDPGTGGPIPDKYIGRIAFDPTNKNTAYIALNGYTGSTNHIWKVTNLNTVPVITNVSGTGMNAIPDVPVNALAIDPLNGNRILAGTDIGVYFSLIGGNTWVPYGQGLPRAAIFDLAIQGSSRTVRAATHGKGMWEIPLLSPTAGPANISGTITSADGAPLAGVTMNLSGALSAVTITDSNGNYHFDELETGTFYTVTPSLANYHFAPANRSFSLLGNKSDAVFTGTAESSISANPIDSTEYFVRQQYLDFLGREPDQGGLGYWSEQINRCAGDGDCLRSRRVDISAAFFIEQEFQQTGSFIFRLYKAGLGRQLRYPEYAADRQQLVAGTNLAASKQAFAEAFVQRPEFVQKYQAQTTAGSFVDALLATIGTGGLDLSAERSNLLASYNTGRSLTESRALAVQQVAENTALAQANYNQAFVLMEYFGYLQRDPEQGGYDFWLNVLNNREPGNYRGMVCAFLTSAEYQRRFGPLVTRSNAECR